MELEVLSTENDDENAKDNSHSSLTNSSTSNLHEVIENFDSSGKSGSSNISYKRKMNHFENVKQIRGHTLKTPKRNMHGMFNNRNLFVENQHFFLSTKGEVKEVCIKNVYLIL